MRNDDDEKKEDDHHEQHNREKRIRKKGMNMRLNHNFVLLLKNLSEHREIFGEFVFQSPRGRIMFFRS